MSTTTFTTATRTRRHARPSSGLVARLRTSLATHRDDARSRRELELILNGYHGATMRNEVQSILDRR